MAEARSPVAPRPPTIRSGPPTTSDDFQNGFAVGDTLIDTAANTAYTCVDNTNDAAVWFSGGGGGVLEKMLIRPYTGDGVNNRIIDLADNYQEIVLRSTTVGESANRVVQAWAILTDYGLFAGATQWVGTNANPYWQGKMTGGDANKIKLGSAGATNEGTNKSGFSYLIVAKKYSTVQA